MYSVILIDDEPWAIKGIRNAFNWEHYGFEITGQFTSAREALAFIIEKSPDLVFTDIRMPELSGLDLIRSTKEKGLDVEFVIVSGVAEFAYAQEALRYGALDYCLKPIDIEGADPLLGKLALHFSEKRTGGNHLILEALTAADKSELKQLSPFFDCSPDQAYRVLVVYSDDDDRGCRNLKFADRIDTLEVELGSRKTLYMLRSEDRTELMGAPFFANSACKAAGLSSISDQAEHMAKLIKEADIAASQIFLHEEHGLFEYTQRLHKLKPLTDDLASMIQEKNFTELDNRMNRLLSYFREYRLGMGEVVYLWNQVVSVLAGAYYEELQDMELDFLNYAELKERFENFESLCSFLSDVFAYVRQLNAEPANEGDIEACFAQMVDYIDHHFHCKLYLKDLSAQFYINQVYCCQLFKKNLGMTFSEYVTELRFKKACELLKHTELSIGEIATRTGYMDYYYFNKVFKKQCGITPAKFRKS